VNTEPPPVTKGLVRTLWSRLALSCALAAALPLAGCGPDDRAGDDLPDAPPPCTPSDCDAAAGELCNTATGTCDHSCADVARAASYLGCEYYPTVTANLLQTDSSSSDGTRLPDPFNFAVAVSNPGDIPVDVTIEGGALDAPVTFRVAPQSAVPMTLPWVDALVGCAIWPDGLCFPDAPASRLVRAGAYHLRSTSPVVVYQFNPLEYTSDTGLFSNSNDASLLLPVTALGSEYTAITQPFLDSGTISFDAMRSGSPGLLVVTATADDTTVTVTPRAATEPGEGAPAFPVDTASSIVLDRGDVLQLTAYAGDLTGSKVESDRPVQVIAGHFCTQVPVGTFACDHLEESMLPTTALGTRYAVAFPRAPAGQQPAFAQTRVVATEPGTTLTFDPPQDVGEPTLAAAGDFVELSGNTDFVVSANHKIAVAQYMGGRGKSDPEGLGDPAMTLAVPIDQFRKTYYFVAPLTYQESYANVVAPAGSSVTLDGLTLSNFEAISATGHGVLRDRQEDTMLGNQ
jgi:hypothetical protein